MTSSDTVHSSRDYRFVRHVSSIPGVSHVMSVIHAKKSKTYDSGDSPVVTHLTTSPPVISLNMEDRTGFLAVNGAFTIKSVKFSVSGYSV
jgi:hypothetical protein